MFKQHPYALSSARSSEIRTESDPVENEPVSDVSWHDGAINIDYRKVSLVTNSWTHFSKSALDSLKLVGPV